jgi:hypothetical protein
VVERDEIGQMEWKSMSMRRSGVRQRAMIALCLFVVLLLPMVSHGTQAVTGGNVVQASGMDFTIHGSAIRFEGVNDQVVLPYQLYPYPQYDYRFDNYLFPTHEDDRPHKIQANDYPEFWYRYFWLVSSLGLNMVRLGGFDAWGLSWMHAVFYNDREAWDSVVNPMLQMARANGVYIDLCLGGIESNCTFSQEDGTYGPRDEVSQPMAGDLLSAGSQAYEEFVRFYADIEKEYANEEALAMIDLLNEPDGDDIYVSYWSQQPDPQGAFEAWAKALTADCRVESDDHLITLGTGGGLLFGWGQASLLGQQNHSADVSQVHVYGTSDDEYLIEEPHEWMSALGRPEFMGEAGYALNDPPWNISYWPWLDTMAAQHGISICWMELEGYPGYPISDATMTLRLDPPDPPADLWAIAGDGHVSLSWVAPAYSGPGPLLYHLFRDGSVVWNGTALAFEDASVTNGQTYSYSVAASNAIGWGLNSTTSEATPRFAVTSVPPGTPANFRLTAGDSSVQLSWNPPTSSGSGALLGYRIYRGNNSSSMPLLTATGGTNFTDAPLINGEEYRYKVSAVGEGGEGVATEIVSATPTARPSGGSDNTMFYVGVGITILIVGAGFALVVKGRRS